MKYKLIKEYPGSPKLGTIAEKEDDNSYYIPDDDSKLTYTELNYHPNIYPEFWEKVVEKDYKITSIIIGSNIGEHTLRSNNKYIFHTQPDSETGCSVYDDLERIKKYKIHSVKRLSDGEIFTIGDKIEFNIHCVDKAIAIITSFKLYGDKLHFLNSNLQYNASLDIIGNKIKQPLFTTKDGVDIFEGDWYFRAATEGIVFDTISKYKASSKNAYPDNKYPDYHVNFSTKETAEKYILMNKPCLSLKDVATIYISADKPITKTTNMSAQNRRIQELVKSKIKQSV